MNGSSRFIHGLLVAYIIVTMVFLALPIVVVIPSAFGNSPDLVFPPQGFSLKWFANLADQRQFFSAFLRSASLAAVSTTVALIIAGLAAIAIVRLRVKGSDLLMAIFASPLIFPSVVLAVALAIVLNGMGLTRTFTGLMLAHTLIVFPYMLRSLVIVLQEVEIDFEQAAATLGANRWKTFRYVTLPLLRPGIIAGVTFSLIISFDDFTVSLFLVGPGLMTLPLELYNYTEGSLDPTVAALSTLLIAMSTIAIVTIEKTVGLAKQLGQ